MARQKFMYAKKKDKQPVVRLVGAILIITLLCIGTLYGYERYSNPNLYGKWQSEETDEIVEFMRDGTIVLENSAQNAHYEMVTPGKMRYNIDGKTFDMNYKIQGRQLSWSVEGEDLEYFNRK
ncbi:MAG: hypothetical protein ACRCTE_10045 [Cellulosilyticaceae bacterium]